MLIEAVDGTAEVGSLRPPARPRDLFERLPDLAGPATAGFSLPAMVLLLSGRFVVPLVVLLGCAGSVALVAAVVRGDPEPALPRDRWWTLAALVLSLAFLVGNAGHSAQRVNASTDAGVRALTGQWLVHHHSLAVPLRDEVFGDPGSDLTSGGAAVSPGVLASPGFAPDPGRPDTVRPAGGHLLAALLGVIGWFAGPVGLFGGNAFIGALALLAVFGLMRRFAGRGLALLSTAALGVSAPVVAAGRDTGSGPLLVLLLAGGGSVLWRAARTRRPARFLAAGLTIGTAGTAGTAGAGGAVAAAAAGLVAVAVALPVSAVAGGRREWLGWLGRLCPLAAGAAVPAGIGYLDLARSPGGPQHAVRVAGALVVGAVVLVAGFLLYRLAGRGRRWRFVAVGFGVLMVAVLAVRTGGLARLRPGAPRLAAVRAVCEALPDDAAVLVLGAPAADRYTQAMRSFCNVPSHAAVPPPAGPVGAVGAVDLRRMRAEVVRHHRRLYVLAASVRVLPTGSARFTDPFYAERVRVWPNRPADIPGSLRWLASPGSPVIRTDGVLLGLVRPDGTCVPVPAPGREHP
ncbi:MAG TPA: hypothetical protein VFX70_01200 [Mycobacteriales bacterium]|nr:hypothetical protein [Mycobacteriales bacterium]